jgi:hypothetical protein
MSSSGDKRSTSNRILLTNKEIFWIIIIILAGLIMFYGLYKEFKDEAEFQKHKENEQHEIQQ